MRRREFLAVGGAGILAAVAQNSSRLCAETPAAPRRAVAWQRDDQAGLFRQVFADGKPLVRGRKTGLLDGFCRLSDAADANGPETALTTANPNGRCGAVEIVLTHHLLAASTDAKENTLEAEITLRNTSDRVQTVEVGFASSARPCPRAADQQVYLPLSAGGLLRDPRLAELGSRKWLQDCRQNVGAEGLECHYLEPPIPPSGETPPSLLLAPVVDASSPGQPWRTALFTTSLLPARVQATPTTAEDGEGAWRMGHVVRLEPGQRRSVRGYLCVHGGDADVAWTTFRRFGHHEDFPAVPWLHDVRVHYFDFLSAADPKGRRGDGYDADLPLFGRFHVGLATQHGYYPFCGDYLHPDRKEWRAMISDPAGPATMSLEKIKARIQATRRAGAHPAVYLHTALFDEGSPLYERLKDSIVVNSAGQMTDFGWQGPDTARRNWKMSVASPAWREHLLQQARWIMELLDPDAIVMDETFAVLGYDHHPHRQGPLGPHGINWMRQMRSLVRPSVRTRQF